MKTDASKRHNQYREYSQKAINKLVDPEFIGIAQAYGSAKKQRLRTQQIRNEYFHEVSAMNKINESIEKNLKKKNKELKYAQDIRNRYISEVLRKQKLKEEREISLERARQRTIQQSLISKARVKQAKNKLAKSKHKQKSETKRELETLKYQKKLQESRLWDHNHSRVKIIEEDKKRIHDYCNRFFQNRNRKFLQSYKQLINKEKTDELKSKKQTHNLQKKLLILKEKASERKKLLEQVSDQIESIRENSISRVSRRSTHILSTRSMTPLQILNSSQKKVNPERLQIKYFKN